MEYLYFMSTFRQAICNGKYVIVIRTGFVKTKQRHHPREDGSIVIKRAAKL